MIKLLIVGVLSACTSPPINVAGWDEQERATVEDIQFPLAIPDFPAAIVTPDGGLIFTNEARIEIEKYQETTEGNYTISKENALALADSARAYNALIDAGEYQERLAIYRQELLDEERKDHFWDNIFHRLVIVALSVGLVL